MIKGLHHNAYRCRDSEETRQFYEDFLGLPLVSSLRIEETKTARPVRALHTFYEMGDGSFLAFFEVPGQPFEFKAQHDFDLHIALEINHLLLEEVKARGEQAGIETRGISNHGSIESVYFRDPNGYVVELTGKRQDYESAMAAERQRARPTLDKWQTDKTAF